MLFAYTGQEESEYPEIFEKMYRQRYEIYVQRRKWKDLRPVGGLEKDQYDKDSAIYLMALDNDDDILACLRLLPTTEPHILGDLFPHLAQTGGVPRDGKILELTRLYVAPFKASKAVRDWLIGVLCAGMIEYCQANKITQITSVIDTFILRMVLSMGCAVRPLGLPQAYPEGNAVAVAVDMTLANLEAIRRSRGVSGPVFVRNRQEPARIPAVVRLPSASVPALMSVSMSV